MSGYLEVKYPLKSNLGLNPFKSWKRQWCILRPSPTCSGGSLAVYCSEAGAAAGTVDLGPGCMVRRAKSRTRPHAFAVFSFEDPRKPRVLLAAQSLTEAQQWMDKITELVNGNKLLGTETLLRDSYSVMVNTTELSRKCGLSTADGQLTISSSGLRVSRAQKFGTFIEWKHIHNVHLATENNNKNKICVLTIDSRYRNGGGELKLWSPQASELVTALKQAHKDSSCVGAVSKLSKSEGDLRNAHNSDTLARRSSWYSRPSDVSMDDTVLVTSKELNGPSRGQLSRCRAAGHLAPPAPTTGVASFDDSTSDRRSLLSVASGIYEEIPDVPEKPDKAVKADSSKSDSQEKSEKSVGGGDPDAVYCKMSREVSALVCPPAPVTLEEPAYESVAECVYATMRRARRPPPPLPPRLPLLPLGAMKLGESWNCRINKPTVDSSVTRHSSLGSLPRCCSISSAAGNPDPYSNAKTLPKAEKSRQGFSVFRKRLKSDSRITASPKSETSKEIKDIDTKKKKFDFTPTRDIFKTFKVNRKMKNLKITGSLAKVGETKSCEFLDETESEPVATSRCSKSVECLEGKERSDEYEEAELSVELQADALELALPQEVVELILRGRRQLNKIRLKEAHVEESDYMPMSPIVPPAPIEHHYIVMSPRTNLA